MRALGNAVMTKLPLKFASFFCLSGLFLAAAFQTQNLGSTVRVYAVPDGAGFAVDGQQYLHAMSAIWPAGSKHTLSVNDTVQYGDNIRYLFQGWHFAGGTVPGGAYVTVTADPAISEYRADFSMQYSLSLNYFSCPDPRYCPSPGKIYVGGAPVESDQVVYLEANATIDLMAVPNPGYVFTGWAPGPNQNIQGFVNHVTLRAPTVVRPQFQVARQIQFQTVPDGLELLADRTRITAPTTLEWGWDSLHTVGVTSPQVDRFGKWWAFSSWSDGGALTHTYKVTGLAAPDTIAATFVPAAVTQIQTSPPGLAVKVDGRENWASFDFIWGVGETHQLEAPAQQTSSDGRAWKFDAWSTGAPAAHAYTVPASTIPGGARIVATYSPLASLHVNSSFAGVTIQVDGVDCPTPCQVERAPGTEVHVSAPASMPVHDDVRADFSGWPGSGSTGAAATYSLAAGTLKLTLEYRLMNRLSAASNPPDGVSWKIEPASPDGFYDSNATVALSVAPRPGYRFKQWSGDLSGNSPYGTLNMNTPRVVQAMLDRIPYVAPSGVANAASGNSNAGVAPGSVASIFGANLGAETVVGQENPLVQSLGGVSARIGERFLPLFFVSPGQINLQVPPDLEEGEKAIVINSVGMPDVQVKFRVVRNAPGLFQRAEEGEMFAVAAHANGSAITGEAPAHPGELVTLYGTGFGPTDPLRPLGFGVAAQPKLTIVDAVSIAIGEDSLPAESALAIAGSVGLDGIAFRIPDGTPASNLRLRAIVNGAETNEVLLPVR